MFGETNCLTSRNVAESLQAKGEKKNPPPVCLRVQRRASSSTSRRKKKRKTHLVLPVTLKIPPPASSRSDRRFRGMWPMARQERRGILQAPPTTTAVDSSSSRRPNAPVSPLGWKTHVQFPHWSTRGLFRACAGPGRGPPGWTGRPRSGPGCGSGCCRWRGTAEGQITNLLLMLSRPRRKLDWIETGSKPLCHSWRGCELIR